MAQNAPGFEQGWMYSSSVTLAVQSSATNSVAVQSVLQAYRGNPYIYFAASISPSADQQWTVSHRGVIAADGNSTTQSGMNMQELTTTAAETFTATFVGGRGLPPYWFNVVNISNDSAASRTFSFTFAYLGANVG